MGACNSRVRVDVIDFPNAELKRLLGAQFARACRRKKEPSRYRLTTVLRDLKKRILLCVKRSSVNLILDFGLLVVCRLEAITEIPA
jgi:hypothetical protein